MPASFLSEELLPLVRVRSSVSGRELSTFAVGGPVSLLIEPLSLAGAQRLVRELEERGKSSRMLGAGSNVVIPDDGISECVIRFGRELSGFRFLPQPLAGAEELHALAQKPEERDAAAPSSSVLSSTSSSASSSASSSGHVLVWAGTSLMSLSRKLCALGFSGLEFAAGIPASLGGAAKMNAGAHGHSMAEVVRSVVVVSRGGELVHLRRAALRYGYRSSELPMSSIIVAVELELAQGDPGRISEERASCLEYRKKTQPLHLPSAGSVFKNPAAPEGSQSEGNQSRAAGELLQAAGMKGVERAGVRYSEMHANWLVKTSDDATASGVKELIALGRDEVRRQFGVELHQEILLW